MKTQKQRIVAIDYFRGICILMVLLNHSAAFSFPFAYIAGASSLWTSAAEMFLLLSGFTYAVVRGGQITQDFKKILRKTWRRAAVIYLVNVLIVFCSLLLALILVSHNLPNDVLGSLPKTTGIKLALNIFTYTYSLGWASFLMFYSMILLGAPMVMYALRKRYWLAVPILSIALYALDRNGVGNVFKSLGIWQIYFVAGLIIGRFRYAIAYLFKKARYRRLAQRTIIIAATIMLSINIFLNFNIASYVGQLANAGWLPVKLQAMCIHLLNHRAIIDTLLMNTRTGLLRPLAALLIAAIAYLIYEHYKATLLEKTGNFVMTMGRNTLTVFAAQALAIPLIAAINLPRTVWMNAILTSFLVLCMWLVARAEISRQGIAAYFYNLKDTYSAGKYAYLRRYEDS